MQAISDYSGKRGHVTEFVTCFETRQKIARVELEECQETGKLVRPDVLIKCETTGKHVLPSQCGRCSVTNKVVLKKHLLVSSVSGALVLAELAVRSHSGEFCLPTEAQLCAWSRQKYHPADLGVCALTGLPMASEFLTREHSRLRPLHELLNDGHREAKQGDYPVLEAAISKKMNGAKCRILSGAISPTGKALAICAELKLLLGLKTNSSGLCLFSGGSSDRRQRCAGQNVQRRLDAELAN